MISISDLDPLESYKYVPTQVLSKMKAYLSKIDTSYFLLVLDDAGNIVFQREIVEITITQEAAEDLLSACKRDR